jgi:lysyl-tRNA synthetase class II
MRRNAIWLSARIIRRYSSTQSAHAQELLWASDGFKTRLSHLRSTGDAPNAFPTSCYPRIKRREAATSVTEFVEKHASLGTDQIGKLKSETVTLNGMGALHSSWILSSTSVGRIKAVRRHGSKLAFLDLEQEEQTVQIFCQFRNVDKPDEWQSFFQTVHEGDHYCVFKPTLFSISATYIS